MKKLLLLLITLLILVGCSNQTTENTNMNMSNDLIDTSIEEVKQDDILTWARRYKISEIKGSTLKTYLNGKASSGNAIILLAQDNDAGKRMLKLEKGISRRYNITLNNAEVLIVNDDNSINDIEGLDSYIVSTPSIMLIAKQNVVAVYNGNDLFGYSIDDKLTQEEYSTIFKQITNELDKYFD